jgi:hypothetical protein
VYEMDARKNLRSRSNRGRQNGAHDAHPQTTTSTWGDVDQTVKHGPTETPGATTSHADKTVKHGPTQTPGPTSSHADKTGSTTSPAPKIGSSSSQAALNDDGKPISPINTTSIIDSTSLSIEDSEDVFLSGEEQEDGPTKANLQIASSSELDQLILDLPMNIMNNNEHSDVATNLFHLNTNILKLNQIMVAMRQDMLAGQNSQTENMKKLQTKQGDLARMLEEKIAKYDKSIRLSLALGKKNKTDLEELKLVVERQQSTIESLQDLIESKDAELRETIEDNNSDLKSDINEVLVLANSIEAHQRRWSVRIVGLEKPGPDGETTAQAKKVACDFFTNYLNVLNVLPKDLDCAHHIGVIDKNKQTMLIRLFSCDLV